MLIVSPVISLKPVRFLHLQMVNIDCHLEDKPLFRGLLIRLIGVGKPTLTVDTIISGTGSPRLNNKEKKKLRIHFSASRL